MKLFLFPLFVFTLIFPLSSLANTAEFKLSFTIVNNVEGYTLQYMSNVVGGCDFKAPSSEKIVYPHETMTLSANDCYNVGQPGKASYVFEFRNIKTKALSVCHYNISFDTNNQSTTLSCAAPLNNVSASPKDLGCIECKPPWVTFSN